MPKTVEFEPPKAPIDWLHKKLFLLDLDGTIFLGNQLLPSSLDFLAGLRRRKSDYLFVSNNSSYSPSGLCQKLKKIGLANISPEEIYTSGSATLAYLYQKGFKNVFLLGTPQLREQFETAGLRVSRENADCVVVGFDKTLDYQKLSDACECIRAGLPFFATHPDLNCPLDNQRMIPDCGAITAAITAATGKKPIVIGKPEATMLAGIEANMPFRREQLVLVGDRLMTDIQMGNDYDITTVLVLTGETRREMVTCHTAQPDVIVERAIDLLPYLDSCDPV
ncbi:HAD-IIA family hydrolase [bacterium]|nr:HAD-IIA family hydrolase [bacterium]